MNDTDRTSQQLAHIALNSMHISLQGAKALVFTAENLAGALPGHDTLKRELDQARGALEAADKQICIALGLM